MTTIRGDEAKVNQFVLFKSPGEVSALVIYIVRLTDYYENSQASPRIGKVLELLVRNDSNRLVTHVALQHLDFLPSRHHTLHLPRLTITEQKSVVEPSVSASLRVID